MADTIVIVLLALIALLLVALLVQARWQHARLMDLLNDLATMIGELFDVFENRK